MLDVAGGKGELSFELFNLNHIASTVIDPRPLLLSRCQTKWRKGQYGPRRTGPLFAKWNPCYNQAVSPAAPPHLRVFFYAKDAAAAASCWEDGGGEEGELWLRRARAAGRRVAWTTKGLAEEEDDHEEVVPESPMLEVDGNEDPHSELDEESAEVPIIDDRPEELTTASEASCLLRDASCVVGLHPDQAAGEIVEFALERGLPFAVVPCCVYKREFPKRRLPDSRPVSNYDDLCEFLKAKHPRIREAKLDFEGKNTVLFMGPEDIAAGPYS